MLKLKLVLGCVVLDHEFGYRMNANWVGVAFDVKSLTKPNSFFSVHIFVAGLELVPVWALGKLVHETV